MKEKRSKGKREEMKTTFSETKKKFNPEFSTSMKSSFIKIAAESDFPIQNLPFGIFNAS